MASSHEADHNVSTIGPWYSRCPRFRGSWPGMWEKVEKNSTSQRGIDIIKRNATKLSRKSGKRFRRVKYLFGSTSRSIRTRGFRIVIIPYCELGQQVFRRFQKTRAISKSCECPFADWLRLTDCFLPDLFNRDLHVRSEGLKSESPRIFRSGNYILGNRRLRFLSGAAPNQAPR